MYKNFTVQARTGRGISRETLDHILRANNNNYLQQVCETISLILDYSVPDQIRTSWLTGPGSETWTYFIPWWGTPVRNKSQNFRLFRCRQWLVFYCDPERFECVRYLRYLVSIQHWLHENWKLLIQKNRILKFSLKTVRFILPYFIADRKQIRWTKFGLAAPLFRPSGSWSAILVAESETNATVKSMKKCRI